MKPINYANSFGVSILGLRLPKYTVYGKIQNRDGSKSLTYYVTDLTQFTNWDKNTVDIYICRYKSQFRKEKFSLNSGLGQMIIDFVFDNHLETKRVEYAYSTQLESVTPKERKPQKFWRQNSTWRQERDSEEINENVKSRKNFIRIAQPDKSVQVRDTQLYMQAMYNYEKAVSNAKK